MFTWRSPQSVHIDPALISAQAGRYTVPVQERRLSSLTTTCWKMVLFFYSIFVHHPFFYASDQERPVRIKHCTNVSWSKWGETKNRKLNETVGAIYKFHGNRGSLKDLWK